MATGLEATHARGAPRLHYYGRLWRGWGLT